jgi:uroporphyrinogen decarboxylase
MEQFMIDMLVNKDIAYEILRRVTDVYVGRLEKVMAALGDRVDLIWTSDDIGQQHGLLMSLDTWRELIFPHHERFNRRVHELGARVMYHTCGSVMKAIPGLIEMGIDVLDVIQTSADDMVPEKIKRQFGEQLAFHGAVDVQLLPQMDSPDAVKQHVLHLIETLGEGGGYIVSPSHNIQADVSPEKILAIYEAAGSLVT